MTKEAFELETKGQDMKLAATETGDPALDCDDDGRFPRRTGTWKTATAHIVTAVIGSGVLSLGWSIAQMGWIFGPIVLIMFSAITWYTAALLCDAYRTGDELAGKRNYTYMAAVKAHLGPGNQIFCAVMQHINLFATGVGYTVTGSLALVAVRRSTCFHNNRGKIVIEDGACSYNNNPWMIFFGGLQLLFSQIPDFGGLWWLSYLATLMSFAYSIIAIILSIARLASGASADHGTVWGVAPTVSSAEATWGIYVALGSMAFAYSFSMILIEIQDTLKQPPSERVSMVKGTHTGIFITTSFYMTVGVLSYAAFGDSVPGNIFTGFGFFEPYWVVGATNVFVFIHLIGAYQVYMQPFMEFVEASIRRLSPDSKLLNYEYVFNMPGYGLFSISPLRLVSRSVIVCCTTVLALLLPFFNDLVGLVGSLGFWPLTVHFPVEMHISARKIPTFSRKGILLRLLSLFTLIISIVSAIGSVAYIVTDIQNYKVFDSVSDSVTS